MEAKDSLYEYKAKKTYKRLNLERVAFYLHGNSHSTVKNVSYKIILTKLSNQIYILCAMIRHQ